MIVIDDASSDSTPQIVERFSRQDRRISFIRHETNWGYFKLGKTYNQALEKARGELIAILEGDDFWPSKKLGKQTLCFKDNEVVLSWGQAAFTDGQGHILGLRPIKNFKKEIFNNRPRGIILKVLLYKNIIPAVSVLIRKSALLRIGGFHHGSYLPFVDYPTFLQISLQGEFSFVDEIVGHWRRYDEQGTSKFLEIQTEAANRYVLEFFPKIPKSVAKEYGLSLEKLRKYQDSRLAFSYLATARVKLAESRWPEARTVLKNILGGRGSLPIKSLALLGIFLSLTKADFEFLAKMKSKLTIKKSAF